MSDLQKLPNSRADIQPWSGPTAGGPSAIPGIEVPAADMKRDYAGLLEYWQMVRRHKGIVLLGMALGALVGFVLTLSDPRVYQAHTTLEIQALNEDFLNLNMKNSSPTLSDVGGYLDIQTQIRILQSKRIVSRVTEKLDAQPRPTDLQPPDRLGVWRKALKLNPPTADALWRQAMSTAANSVRVRSSGDTRIVDASCDSTSPQLAADFCNTLAREFIEENLEARWQLTEHTGDWLTKQLQDLKIRIEKSGQELQNYASATGLIFTGEKNDAQEARLADLQKELSAAQTDRILKQSRYEMAVASTPSALPEVLDDPALKAAQTTIADLNAKLAQLRVTFTDSQSDVRRLLAEIAVVEGSQQKALANITTRIRNDFESAQRRESLLATNYQEQAKLVGGQAESTAHYNLLKREVDSSRLLYDSLQQRLKEASIASALRASNIRVVDVAEKPSTPYKPDAAQRTGFGLLAGLVLGVALVVLRERADRTLQDPGDPAYYLRLPELGVVPISEMFEVVPLKGRAKSLSLQSRVSKGVNGSAFADSVELVSWSQKTSLLAESYRTTLTSILFSTKNGERPRVLIFTSASPKEGKTTTVCNLGIALAEINQRVLIIDGDMRRPRLHKVFDLENGLGLSDLLVEKASLDGAHFDTACQPTSVPGLFVLPSGNSRRNASSLLHSPRLPELLDFARGKFDTVIVDTPPMVNIADARVIARYGDASILVVRSGSTTRDAALLAKNRFAEDGIQLLGTILNFWNPKTPGYSYYKYYYAGYYHYYKGPDSEGPTGDDEPGDEGKVADIPVLPAARLETGTDRRT